MNRFVLVFQELYVAIFWSWIDVMDLTAYFRDYGRTRHVLGSLLNFLLCRRVLRSQLPSSPFVFMSP
jgi:hypothetical protein